MQARLVASWVAVGALFVQAAAAQPAAPSSEPGPRGNTKTEKPAAPPTEPEPGAQAAAPDAPIPPAETAAGQTTPPEASEEAVPETTPRVAPATPAAPMLPAPTWPTPGADARELARQGRDRPKGDKKPRGEVFAEDWWSHTRPLIELHGYFRVRAELFHNFSLSRIEPPGEAIWPRPLDQFYRAPDGNFGPQLCTADEANAGDNDDPAKATFGCQNKTQSSANLRLRFNPELVISDNLRVNTQIDLLDNLVLGSTPAGYRNAPSVNGGYAVAARSGYVPIGFYENTQAPSASGINSLGDSISVKRAWAEYTTPVGQLRFGRMPSHWGLGIFQNSGDGYDADYQSTVDRIAVVTGIKPLDLYIAGAWDFPNEGATSQAFSPPGGQPYDLAQLDDVDQYVLAVFRRKSPELLKLALARGRLVLNGGLYLMHQNQLLANDVNGAAADCSSPDSASGAAAIDCAAGEAGGFVRRGASFWIPDAWLQLLYRKFRFEAEVVTIQGHIENTETTPGASDYVNPNGDNGWDVNQWGIATEIEQKLVEDKLRLGFHWGWASGDADVEGLIPLNAANGGQLGDRTLSTFRFHPAYRIDLILHRNLLSRIQGTYYFRPSVTYDFMRTPQGQRIGGGAAAIWTRASQFIQAPGHERDLGIELNAQLYFQSKDGGYNDNPENLGGFFTKLEYGVLFPLRGLGYQQGEAREIASVLGADAANTGTAQTLRWFLGVLF